MIAQMIRCDSIDMPTLDKKERSFKKDFADELARSIEFDGLLQPIVLRPNTTKPGRFSLVAGRNRLHAVHKILKREEIASVVVESMDDEDAESATVAENLWRFPFTKPQHYVAVAKWHKKYKERHPRKVGSGGPRAGQSHAEPKGHYEILVRPGPGIQGGEGEPTTPSFPEVLAAATGTSLSKANVATKIATTFEPEQLEIFDQMQTGTVEMRTVAGIKDKTNRDEVVNLIAIGRTAAEAIAEVTKPADGQVKLHNGHKVQIGPKPEADPDETLTDKEWADKYCIDVLRRLRNPTPFLADAALYRATESARAEFRSKARKALAAARDAGARGGLYGAMSRVVNLSHPKHWLVCGTCRGEGSWGESNGLTEKCGECPGGGYITRTETY